MSETGGVGGETPRASVVIPAYNAAATLGEQLAALAEQDAQFPFEVLVCDNGSTDGTRALVAVWQKRMPALRSVDASRRRGASAARNIGAREARTDALLFCDADDVADRSWVREMCAALEAHEFVAGLVEHAHLNPHHGWDVGWSEPTYREDFLPWLPAGGSGNMGVRAALFESVGGFDETRLSGEDADLCWRIQLAGTPLASAPAAIMHVRKREGFRATWKQGFAKGRAVRQLKHDYEQVARAFSDALAQRTEDPVALESSPVDAAPDNSAGTGPMEPNGWLQRRFGRIARAPRRLVRILRSPSQVLREYGELARGLGLRFGRIDRTRAQVLPGDVTPLLR